MRFCFCRKAHSNVDSPNAGNVLMSPTKRSPKGASSSTAGTDPAGYDASRPPQHPPLERLDSLRAMSPLVSGCGELTGTEVNTLNSTLQGSPNFGSPHGITRQQHQQQLQAQQLKEQQSATVAAAAVSQQQSSAQAPYVPPPLRSSASQPAGIMMYGTSPRTSPRRFAASPRGGAGQTTDGAATPQSTVRFAEQGHGGTVGISGTRTPRRSGTPTANALQVEMIGEDSLDGVTV